MKRFMYFGDLCEQVFQVLQRMVVAAGCGMGDHHLLPELVRTFFYHPMALEQLAEGGFQCGHALESTLAL